MVLGVWCNVLNGMITREQQIDSCFIYLFCFSCSRSAHQLADQWTCGPLAAFLISACVNK